MPARIERTMGEISDWMTAQLCTLEDCAGSALTVKYRLRELNETGCNWSEDCNIRVGPNATSEYIAPLAAPIVRAARAQFNMAD